jgi:hypothetical protein
VFFYQPGSTLSRIHRKVHEPWWFASDGASRFDLVGLGSVGTCYLAETPLASFVEVFRDVSLITIDAVNERVVSRLPLPQGLRVADCTSGLARRFGVTAAIHASEDYELTQAWATKFFAEGFSGIRYQVSHDPSQRLIGVALFGSVLPNDPSEVDSEWITGRRLAHHFNSAVRKLRTVTGRSSYADRQPIAPALLAEAESEFGIRVRPQPRQAIWPAS